MSDHLCDTVFGQIVRLLSGRKFLKFPDEQDLNLWDTFVRKPNPPATRDEEKDSDNSGTPTGDGIRICQEEEYAVNTLDSAQVLYSEGPHSWRQDILNRHERNAEVILVDWYDAKDQERGRSYPWVVSLRTVCIYQSEVKGAHVLIVPITSGYGLGPMLFSPMSEIPTIGRSRIYFWTLFAFVLLQLPTGYAINMAMLLVFRFLTGFFGGPVLAIGGATIIDMYPPIEVPYWIGIYGASGVLGPVLGPLVGGFAAQAKGWRWPIWELTWLCAVVLVVLFFFMPETSAANILYRRAKRLRKQTGKATLKSQSEIDAAEVTLKDHLVVLGRAFTLTFSEPVVFFVDLYCALLYGVLYIWFESFPLVFGEIYGFNIGEQGLTFLGIFVGGVVTVPCYLYWVRNHLMVRLAHGHFQPEVILPPTFFGAFALPVCLFWYGWTSRESTHWMVPLVGSGCFTISIITLFMPVLSYLGMAYPQYAASVLAGNTLFRASCGVVFPLFVRRLYHIDFLK
ncbi:caffeine resistance protein, putative [Talaromyces stipitatus ATCC 10500]|uniref:Caffeine resistance protein, putative n=1 Tax=Talaromyces stipitatus (strain ATCC 10500 / CBS 375.48 / QM 6759 / NRRL 1006) TaxID=441959 RepID=B8MKR8_TALSN|nr:caffeine resistance protein, putative [Talaromyces stipitatus ATCC 10500]EED14917.1 caffeine resistance protein, putative [Talaromyces stipitatus ATCC 10500]